MTHIPRDKNIHADALVVSARSFKIPYHTDVLYQIQVKYRPSIPDNLKHLQIFEDDEHLKSFLQVIDEFSVLQIHENRTKTIENSNENDNSDFNSKIANHDIIQLCKNFIPKGLIPLEKLFDQNDVLRNPLSISPQDDIEEVNIGTNDDIGTSKSVHP